MLEGESSVVPNVSGFWVEACPECVIIEKCATQSIFSGSCGDAAKMQASQVKHTTDGRIFSIFVNTGRTKDMPNFVGVSAQIFDGNGVVYEIQ